MIHRVRLMLCVNNLHGAFTGRCRSISLWDTEALTIESPYFDSSLKCWIDRDGFGLGAKEVFGHRGQMTWVGNCCWDAVLTDAETAADAINFAVRKGYRPTVGAIHLFDKTSNGQRITTDDLMAVLET